MKILKRCGFCLLLTLALLPAVTHVASADTNTAPLPTASLLSTPATTTDDAAGDGYAFDEESGTLTITSQAGMNYWGDWEKDTSGVQHLVIEGDNINIPGSAFDTASSLESVKISGNSITIGSYTFSTCPVLTSVQISGQGTTIGASAFGACPNLTTVQILDGVASIGVYAFSSCTSLASVEIAGSVTNINLGAFGLCTELKTVVYTGMTAPTLGTNAFLRPNDDPITVLAQDGFSGTFGDLLVATYSLADSILTITSVPDGVTSIGYPSQIGDIKITEAKCQDGITAELEEIKVAFPDDMAVISAWTYVNGPTLDENNVYSITCFNPPSKDDIEDILPKEIMATVNGEQTKLPLTWTESYPAYPADPATSSSTFDQIFPYMASVSGYTFSGGAPTIKFQLFREDENLYKPDTVRDIELNGSMPKEELLAYLPTSVAITEGSETKYYPVTWKCTSHDSINWNSTDTIYTGGDYVFEATAAGYGAQQLPQKVTYTLHVTQTMIELRVGSGQNGTWATKPTNTLSTNDVDSANDSDQQITWKDKNTGNEYTVSISGYTGNCSNGYLYIYPEDAEQVQYTSDDKHVYRLEMTVSGENAENAELVLSQVTGYRSLEDYESHDVEASRIYPESYVIDAAPSQITFALIVAIDEDGKLCLNMSQGFEFHSSTTSHTFTLKSEVDGYSMSFIDGNTSPSTTFGNLGKVFFNVTPPTTEEERSWAVMLMPTSQLNSWNNNTNTGIVIDTSWHRQYYIHFDRGWRYALNSLFRNETGQFVASYLSEQDMTAVVTELTLSPSVDNPSSVGLKGHATLSVDADYQYKGISSDLKVHYQWYKCTDENRSGAEAIPGATSSTYTPSTEQAGTYYYFVKAGFDEFTEVNGYKDSTGKILQDYDPYGWASDTVTKSEVMTLTVGDTSEVEPPVEDETIQATYGEIVSLPYVHANIGEAGDSSETVTITADRVGESGNVIQNLGTATEASTDLGKKSFTYDTTQKGLAIGENKVRLTFKDSDGNTLGSLDYTVTLNCKEVTPIVIEPITKVYDGSDAATVELGFADGAILADDDVTVTAPNATYDSADVGENKTITLGDLVVTGNDDGYYEIVAPTEPLTGSITAESTALTLSADPASLTGGGTVTLSLSGLPDGETATLACDDGSITITPGANNTWTVTLPNETKTYTFTATYAGGGNYAGATATCQVSVTHQSTGSGGGSSSGTLPPKVEEGENGDVTVSPSRPQEGQTVTITPQPDEGYVVDEITVIDGDGNPVNVTDNGDGSYSFVQPDSRVTITVTFRPYDPVLDCPQDDSCPLANYEDLDPLAWYHAGVHYCLDHGLMVGMTDTLFEPQGTTTRAQVVTILWRLENAPEASSAAKFDDVADDAWYAGAVRWAASEGIVGGFGDGTFAPDAPVTREQLASMLNRYAAWKGEDVSARGDLSAFTDVDSASWSAEVLAWAKAEGLLGGISATTLEPTGNATRAQIATVIMRFCEQFLSE